MRTKKRINLTNMTVNVKTNDEVKLAEDVLGEMHMSEGAQPNIMLVHIPRFHVKEDEINYIKKSGYEFIGANFDSMPDKSDKKPVMIECDSPNFNPMFVSLFVQSSVEHKRNLVIIINDFKVGVLRLIKSDYLNTLLEQGTKNNVRVDVVTNHGDEKLMQYKHMRVVNLVEYKAVTHNASHNDLSGLKYMQDKKDEEK